MSKTFKDLSEFPFKDNQIVYKLAKGGIVV